MPLQNLVKQHQLEPSSDEYSDPWNAIAAWFLGPRAENRELLNRLVLSTLNFYEDCRENYHPADPCYITEEVKASPGFRGELKDLEKKLGELNNELSDSIPFYSTRYQGHMIWETTMPATLGYFAGMLWNQNNVDSTASPVTTQMEILVGKHLCDLIQFSHNNPKPWALITSCGTVANIEALWSARNLKFHPLAIKACVMDKDADSKLKVGASLPIYLAELSKAIPLQECSQWQLLNLDVDTVCNLTSDLKKFCNLENTELIDSALKKHSVVSIGLGNFVQRQQLANSPVIFCPGTCHYSYPKAATILGLGDQSIIPLEVDRNCRVNMAVLRKKLESHLELKIPIITVVAVIGSTEESAIDPIAEMFDMRAEFQKRGLNFTIHADAAWGGYLLTMIREASDHRLKKLEYLGESFVPEIPLSDYAAHQYKSVKLADTVTIDPHKSGFCQYPAGALAYRNGVMKGFITLQAPEVFHSESDISVGVYGLEGSKPGAAAAGVLLAHRVLGLDETGLGRVLGQCQLGAKLFYCMWMTVARDYDDFICLNFIDLPEGYDTDETRKFIRDNILGKDNRELAANVEVMNFLAKVGPDALINTFTVNIKGNSETHLCNQLQDIIFSELNGTVGKSSKRVPLFLTKSEVEEEKYGEAFRQFKTRLGLSDHLKINFLRNTAMNPFQASEAFVTEISKLFRNCIMNSIGGLKGSLGDVPTHHCFIVSGKMLDDENKIFLDYIPTFADKSHQYNVVLTMKAVNETEKIKFIESCNTDSTYVCKTKYEMAIMDFLRKTSKHGITMELYKYGADGTALCAVDLTVDEVFRYEHLENPKSANFIEYPTFQKYFLYGDKKRAFISHVITKYKDFHQVVELDEIPHSVPEVILDMGAIITIPDISGRPFYLGDKISDPLQGDNYVVEFKGKQYIDCKTTIRFQKATAKKYFDFEYLNNTK
ncbi:uncharacterized protein LOC100209120 isoform X2 [Hydra vulgaris]|uniref:uncharacterized protein LOC100209120 isoform X2 n=1 Tax=Hydra vulgaris TaxID=6087 RepID=UPI0032EA0115